MKITGKTRLIGIFGDPITHTLSPAMHNAAFEELGLDMVYVPCHVKPRDLKQAVEGARAMGLAGLNITVPHKERVLKYIDAIDDRARVIGAVNTVVNEDGALRGYDTDALGFLRSLQEDFAFEPRGKRIVIIGAGGASRALVYEFLALGAASLTLVNRTVSRAELLAGEYGGLFPGVEVNVCSMEEFSACATPACAKAVSSAELMVNATSVGLMGAGELDVPLEKLPQGAIVSDIVYRPLETGFLRKAGKLGLRPHSGLGMLVHQGAVAFELWTGAPAPIEVMKKAALAELKKTE